MKKRKGETVVIVFVYCSLLISMILLFLFLAKGLDERFNHLESLLLADPNCIKTIVRQTVNATLSEQKRQLEHKIRECEVLKEQNRELVKELQNGQ